MFMYYYNFCFSVMECISWSRPKFCILYQARGWCQCNTNDRMRYGIEHGLGLLCYMIQWHLIPIHHVASALLWFAQTFNCHHLNRSHNPPILGPSSLVAWQLTDLSSWTSHPTYHDSGLRLALYLASQFLSPPLR